MRTVGLIAPGSMGAAVGACLVAGGTGVLWASEGRGAATRDRAERAGLHDVGHLDALCDRSDLVLSICPPHAAVEVAEQVAAHGFAGRYLDANAVAPATARAIAGIVPGDYLDGGIIGGPPERAGTTRLYLAGPGATEVADLFARGPLEAVVLAGDAPAASALKLAYASWTKGSSALLLAARALASAEGVEDDLVREWERSQPELPARSEAVAAGVAPKAWRWVGEMDEIADAYGAAGLPEGFHRAAAEVYRRLSPRKDVQHTGVAEAIADLRDHGSA